VSRVSARPFRRIIPLIGLNFFHSTFSIHFCFQFIPKFQAQGSIFIYGNENFPGLHSNHSGLARELANLGDRFPGEYIWGYPPVLGAALVFTNIRVPLYLKDRARRFSFQVWGLLFFNGGRPLVLGFGPLPGGVPPQTSWGAAFPLGGPFYRGIFGGCFSPGVFPPLGLGVGGRGVTMGGHRCITRG